MQKTVTDPSEETIGKRKWTTGRSIAVGIGILIVAFLIIGTINDANTPDPEFSFGIQSQSFLVLAFLAFGGGLLSFLSPCTLPILPAYFAFAFQSGRSTIAANTMMFLLGLATMFSLLGAGASALGRVLQQSQQVILLVGGAAVLIFGVVSLMGGGFGGMKAASTVERDTSLGGSFVFGLTFAVGWVQLCWADFRGCPDLSRNDRFCFTGRFVAFHLRDWVRFAVAHRFYLIWSR